MKVIHDVIYGVNKQARGDMGFLWAGTGDDMAKTM